MIRLYYNNTNVDIQPDDSSYRYRALMEQPQLVLKFSLPIYIEFPVGTWCEWQGERYSLWSPQNIKKNGERNIEYSITMYNDEQLMSVTKLRNSVDNRLKFSMCAKPHEFIEEIVRNLNKKEGEDLWTVGTCIDATEKTIEFNHSYIDEALQSVADTFETEWEIVNKQISLHKVEYYKTDPLPLSYGKGNGFVPGVGRTSVSDEQPVKRLYVQGGSRNIDRSQYGSADLLLPLGQSLEYEGRTYRSSSDGLYIERLGGSNAIKEDSLDCSEIYPSRVGTVSELIAVNPEKNFYDIVDSSIPQNLDFNNYLIAGETMTIIFQTGMLAKREFEVKYKHADRRFEIDPQEFDGITMPNETFKPVAGGQNPDKYAIFGIMMPGGYVCNNATKTGASWNMFREAARYLYEHEEQKFTFTGTLQGLWAKRNWMRVGGHLEVGAYIMFSDPQFAPEGTSIRIMGIKDYLYSPYTPTLEISNSVSGKSVGSQLKEINNKDVVIEDTKREVMSFTKRRFRDAQETLGMLNDSLLNFSESVNPITVQTMAMLLGDESLQFRFVDSKETLNPIAYNITYNNETKRLNCPAVVLQHMTLGISNISSSHKKDEYKVWEMTMYNQVIAEAEKKYYLYAKVNRTNMTEKGVFIPSERAIQMDEEAGYYYLLVGVLNSELEGERCFVNLYGYTEILPGRITTDMIVSADGKTYFDLANSIIAGTIHFRNSDGELEDVQSGINSGINAFGDTIIEGGHIKTELIDANAIRTQYLEISSGREGDLRQISATPDNMAIDIYNEDGEKCTSFEGLTHNGVDDLFGGTSGTCNIVLSTETIKEVHGIYVNKETTKDVSDVWHTDAPTQVTINSGYLYATATSPEQLAAQDISSVTSVKPLRRYASVYIRIVVETYSDEACTMLVGTQTIANCTATASATAAGTSDTRTLSVNIANKKAKTSSGGYHKIVLDCSQSASQTTDRCSAKFGYDGSGLVYPFTASYNSDFYVSRYFANGFCLGERSDNYVMAYRTAKNGMRCIMENNGFGIDFSNSRPKIKHNGGKWINMPLLIYKGYGYYNSSKNDYNLSTRTAWNGEYPQISRTAAGNVTIGFPDSWAKLNLSTDNTIVNAIGIGEKIKITVGSINTSSLTLQLTDSTSLKDGQFMIDISLC